MEPTKTTYVITFEDIFDFSTDRKTVDLTTEQYHKAIEQMKNREIVVNKRINDTHTQLIIKNIEPLFYINQQAS